VLFRSRQAARLKPDEGLPLAELGTALYAKGVVQEGLTCLSNAANLSPNDTGVRYRLAITLLRLKQYDQAVAHFQRILRLDPRHADALVGLAASYDGIGQRDKALNCLEGALEIARSGGNQRLAEQIAKQITLLKQRAL
jgi:Flp pilus assembly protein TadD